MCCPVTSPKTFLSTQQAFVLNLNQHWFTLRRFGQPGGTGHWFNLNSFFESPERIGKMYLGMVLQQAEAEGATPCDYVDSTQLMTQPFRILCILGKTLA
jgi:hypothetical protein